MKNKPEPDVYLSGDQPTTCPRCGARTSFTPAKEEHEVHTCMSPHCGYTFLVEEQYQPGHPFPNGFDSWTETFYEIVAHFTEQLIRDTPGEVSDTQAKGGQAALCEYATELTDKFEQLHQGEEWIEQDFFDTLDAFLKQELKP